MKKTALIITILLLLSAASCGSERPPDDGTPEPPALSGEFVSEQGTFTFNGDGTSITTDTTPEFEQLCGLPAGEHEDTYVFLYQHGKWRYDKSDTFRIMIGEDSYEFINDFTLTNENAVVIRPIASDSDHITFEKKNSEDHSE